MRLVGDRISRAARRRLGLQRLRPGQREAVEAVLKGRDTLVVGTYAVVLFSLLVQAPTLGWYLQRLGVAARR